MLRIPDSEKEFPPPPPRCAGGGGGETLPCVSLEPGTVPWPGLLLEALAQSRIRAAYQPIVTLTPPRTMVGEEALVRLVTTEGAVIPAGAFIAAAHTAGLVPALDEVVLTETLARCVAWTGPPRLYFINVSTALLTAPDRLDALIRAVVPGGRCRTDDPYLRSVVFEITERELLSDLAAVRKALNPLLDAGVRLALDDFGSGYSSFLYLADLPVSFLKIEQALIRRLGRDRRVTVMVAAVTRMAADLGITVIAEGIESARVAREVRALGIPWGQGYYFGRPGWG